MAQPKTLGQLGPGGCELLLLAFTVTLTDRPLAGALASRREPAVGIAEGGEAPAMAFPLHRLVHQRRDLVPERADEGLVIEVAVLVRREHMIAAAEVLERAQAEHDVGVEVALVAAWIRGMQHADIR